MFYVYLLQNEKQEIYIGSTNNLKKRFKEHNSKRYYSTKGHNWKVIYYEAFLSESDARNREHQLKQCGQALAQLKRRIKESFNRS